MTSVATVSISLAQAPSSSPAGEDLRTLNLQKHHSVIYMCEVTEWCIASARVAWNS